jgi:hypothetical protein
MGPKERAPLTSYIVVTLLGANQLNRGVVYLTYSKRRF